MPFPIFAAGQRLLASNLRDMQPAYVRKVTDQSRTSTTTLANDASLFLTVAANAVYKFDAIIYYSTRSDTDFKMLWTLPSGSMDWTIQGLTSGASGTAGDVYFGRLALADQAVLGGAALDNTTVLSVTIKGTVTIGGTAGLMRHTWAQNVSNAVATIVRGDSWMKLKRLA